MVTVPCRLNRKTPYKIVTKSVIRLSAFLAGASYSTKPLVVRCQPCYPLSQSLFMPLENFDHEQVK